MRPQILLFLKYCSRLEHASGAQGNRVHVHNHEKFGRPILAGLNPSERAMQRLARRQFPGFFRAYLRRCGQRSCANGSRGQNRSAPAERGAEASNGAAMISPNFAVAPGEDRMPFCLMAHQDSAACNLQMHIQAYPLASRIRFVIVSG
jgi:hypothetical protein